MGCSSSIVPVADVPAGPRQQEVARPDQQQQEQREQRGTIDALTLANEPVDQTDIDSTMLDPVFSSQNNVIQLPPLQPEHQEEQEEEKVEASGQLSRENTIVRNEIVPMAKSDAHGDRAASKTKKGTRRCDPTINFSSILQRIQCARVTVMLPLTAPLAGKTSTFEQLHEQFKSSPHISFLQSKSSDAELNDSIKLVVLVKSSDEYTARMIKEHRAIDPEKSEDEIRKETHMGFWTELDEDFAFLCELVKDGKRSAVMIMDKNHCHTAFNTNSERGPIGLTSGTYGWTRTVNEMRAKCPPGVQLQFSAIVLHELVKGLDYGEYWPYPFTPEMALALIQRARAREGHLTRSKDESDLAIKLFRFLKLFDRAEMLKSAKDAVRMVNHAAYTHYALTMHSLYTIHSLSLCTRYTLAMHSLCSRYALTMHSPCSHYALTMH